MQFSRWRSVTASKAIGIRLKAGAIPFVVAQALGPTLCLSPAVATDRATVECLSKNENREQQIAACTELLGRPRLPMRAKSDAYNNRAYAQLQLGKTDLAIADYTSAIQVDQKSVRAFYNRYSAYAKKGDLTHALADLQTVASLSAGAQTAQQQSDLALVQLSIAQLQRTMRRYPDAVKSFEAAIATRTTVNGPGDAFVLGTQRDLARTLMEMDRLAEAETQIRSVIARIQEAEGRDSASLAENLQVLAAVLSKRTRLAEAQAAAERAAALFRTSAGPESSDTADALIDLATIYAEQNRFDDSFKTNLQALAIREKISGPNSPETALVLGNLGLAYREVGRLREAEDYSLRALKAYTKAEGTDGANVSRILNNLAIVYVDEKRLGEAATAQKRALAIVEGIFGTHSELYAMTLMGLGNTLIEMGRATEAEPLFLRSIAITEHKFGPQSADLAKELNNLARALHDQKRENEAAALLQRAVSIDEALYGSGSPQMVPELTNLARAEHRLGHLDRAGELLQQAAKAVRASDPALRASIAYEQGQVAGSRNDWSQAETFYNQVLALYTQAFGPDYPTLASVWERLGRVANKQNDVDKALALLRNGAAIAAKAEEASGSHGDFPADWYNLASFAWGAAVRHPEQAAALSGEAFVATQRTQLGPAGAALAQMAARFGAGLSAASSEVREQQDLTAQAQALDGKLNAALGAASQDPNALATLRAQIVAVDTRLKDTVSRIASDFPTYAELASPQPLTLAKAQALLRPDEALVTWLFSDDESFIFAVTHDGSDWRRVALSEAQLTDTVAKLRASLDLDKVTRGLARGDTGRDIVFNIGDAYALYQQLLEPVQALIGPKTNLIVVPAGALTSLPLQVLVTEPPKRAATSMADSAYGQAAWLAKSHAITVLPSVASLRALRTFAKPTQATKPLVGFADPVFGRSSDGTATRGGATRVADVGSYAHFFRGGDVDVDALRNGLPALPETAGELRAVADQLHATGADLKFGEAATVSEVRALPLDQFRVVYFATHGLVAGDVKGLTEPALALTVPAHPTPADSGLLTASDVAQLKLDADWVVLSACNTASGDTPGAEGLSGLARAFFYAGARALLVSHWPVRSDAAVQLTTHAFAAMAADPALDRAEALRRSELALIAAGGDNAYPAVWAPFVVVGEGGSGRS